MTPIYLMVGSQAPSHYLNRNHNKEIILITTKKLLSSLNSMSIDIWVPITTQLYTAVTYSRFSIQL